MSRFVIGALVTMCQCARTSLARRALVKMKSVPFDASVTKLCYRLIYLSVGEPIYQMLFLFLFRHLKPGILRHS